MTSSLRSRAARALRKPPHVVARRLAQEGRAELERVAAPRRARRLTEQALLTKLDAADVSSLWDRLATAPYVCAGPALEDADIDEVAPGERSRILLAAEDAVERRVNLLGSGPTELGTPVDWLLDFKTGRRWEPAYARRIEYANLDEPSDVKVPWELSRMQWLIPAAQAYVLTGDERYATATRVLIDEWIDANPYTHTVNWSCTMDVALRAMTWTYLFHSLHASDAWSDSAFRTRFLRSLFLHGDFTERNLELSDVNGNHYTADAAGLVFIGLYFGQGTAPERWHRQGWQILLEELPRQVMSDGVDFEASCAYHRLVTELFFLPALYRLRRGYDVPDGYRARLAAMAGFASAYARDDGTTPLWGDADDARALPLGGQNLNDHRYLAGVIGLALSNEALAHAAGPRTEALWLHGARAAASLPDRATPPDARSKAFGHGGFYVLRRERDHVFVDCGPVGLAGRGGHGHNDCLALEAVLDGAPVLVDRGSYVYTASPTWRDRFRSTAAHNTPRVDGEEQNRITERELWSLQYDAVPTVSVWRPGSVYDVLRASHTGYQRISQPVLLTRTIVLEHHAHRLLIYDAFTGDGEHRLDVPFHFPPGASVREEAPGLVRVVTPAGDFALQWLEHESWSGKLDESWVSPSYGIKLRSSRLELSREGELSPVTVIIAPADNGPTDPSWAERILAMVDA